MKDSAHIITWSSMDVTLNQSFLFYQDLKFCLFLILNYIFFDECLHKGLWKPVEHPTFSWKIVTIKCNSNPTPIYYLQYTLDKIKIFELVERQLGFFLTLHYVGTFEETVECWVMVWAWTTYGIRKHEVALVCGKACASTVVGTLLTILQVGSSSRTVLLRLTQAT